MAEGFDVMDIDSTTDDRQQRILVVEDDRSQARLIELIFENSDLQLDLRIVHTLDEANALLASISFDLVITDLNLPDGRGTDLLPSDQTKMSCPVMLLTGQGDEKVAVQAIKSGAVDYIVKNDASFKSLPNTVSKILREWGNVLLRREMEEALRQKQLELEEKHQQLLVLFKEVSRGKREWELTIDCVNDLILRTDSQGKIRRVNRAVVELTGCPFQTLVGMDVSEIVGELTVCEAELHNVEFRHSGSGRVFILSSYLLEDPEIGSGMVLIAHDYTAISELNKQLGESNRELGKKTSELEQAYDTLKQTQNRVVQQEKMATVGQLAAGVAHEINNPMGYILSNLGTLGKYLTKLTNYMKLQDELVNQIEKPELVAVFKEQKKEFGIEFILSDLGDLIAESLDGAERVRKIVADLKGFSHQTEDSDELTDLNQLLESTIPIVWNEIKYKATLNRNYGEIPQVFCRKRLIGQVIINLLVNAVHSIEKQGVITITTWQENDTVNLAISDTGCGISEAVIKRIFDPFFTTKEVGVGTGLGLSISCDIIKQHGGELVVDSVIGEGSTFTIVLPLTLVEASQDHDLEGKEKNRAGEQDLKPLTGQSPAGEGE